MSYRDHYSTLGVARDADAGEIKRAYRKLARKHHPDVSREPDSETRFKEINAAYEVLGDEEKRGLYDRYGDAWKAISEGHAPPPGAEDIRSRYRGPEFDPDEHPDLASLFESLFGGSTGTRTRPDPFRWQTAGVDYETALDLTLTEALRGGERDLELGDPSSGETRRLRVRIPRGVRDGQRIRLSRQGGAGEGGGPDGDLYLRVRLLPHPDFRKDGDDIATPLPLAPWEATLGATVTVRTLDGPVRVKVPPGSSTGRRIRLRDQGYPRSDGTRGDLYAEVRVEVPRSPSPEERELMEKLAEVSAFRARPYEEES